MNLTLFSYSDDDGIQPEPLPEGGVARHCGSILFSGSGWTVDDMPLVFRLLQDRKVRCVPCNGPCTHTLV